ncbi:MAG: hypothetical protein IJZ56_04640 [Oscillospiraceae bacterium]|nr:hypothetical protein [Oscillospiraceae bacterium]
MFVFLFIFLALRQQGYIICAKLQNKNPRCGVLRSFQRAAFVKISKITQGIPVGIFKGFSAVLAESCL